MLKAIYNGKIFTGDQVVTNKAILTRGDIIAGIIDEADIPGDCTLYDLMGMYIAPSFIDLQIYGGNGKLFSRDPSIESLTATYEYCRAGGASHFMITVATNSMDKYLSAIEGVKAYWSQGGKGLLGLHLEGPYINPVKKGAHVEGYIRRPVFEELRLLLQEGKDIIKMVTLAPECCDDAIVELMAENGIIVSAGHSNATYREAIAGFNKGIPAATHLFNAMSAFQGREPGMVGAIYHHSSVMSSIICDGIHVDFASVAISAKMMGGRLFFITDAVTATPGGEYQHVFKNDHYTLPNGTLSGSALTMMQCVKNAVQHVGITLEEALRMASLYPAKLIGRSDTFGRIQKGYQASFVVFDEEFRIKS